MRDSLGRALPAAVVMFWLAALPALANPLAGTNTPSGGQPAAATNTPLPTATPQTAPTALPARPTPTTAVQILNTATPVAPQPTPTVPRAVTPTFTFTPVQRAATAVVLGTPTPGIAPALALTSTAAGPAPTTPPPPTATAQPAATAVPPSATAIPPTATASGECAASGNLILSEILTNPNHDWGAGSVAGSRWAELYNASDGCVSLTNWAIQAGGGQAPLTAFPAGTTIPGHAYLVVFPQALLAQRIGAISLAGPDPTANPVDSVTLPDLGPDEAYARHPGCLTPDSDGCWATTDQPTPGQDNVIVLGTPAGATATAVAQTQATIAAIQTQLAEPTPAFPTPDPSEADLIDATELETGRKPARSRKGETYPAQSILQARGLPDDTALTLTGAVTMPPGIIEATRGYVQDGGAGILFHSYGAVAIQLGDRLTIKGRIHHVHGEVEIAAIKNGERAEAGGDLPDPTDVPPDGVGPAHEALLVRISGTIQGKGGDYATLAGDTGSAKVYLPRQLNLPADSLNKGDQVTAVGVVNATDTNGYRLAPRGGADISIASSAGLSSRAARSIEHTGAQGAGVPGRPGTARQAAPRSSAPAGGATALLMRFVTPVSAQGAVRPELMPSPAAGSPIIRLEARLPDGGVPWWIWPAIAGALAAGAGASVGVSQLIRLRAAQSVEPDAPTPEDGSEEDRPD